MILESEYCAARGAERRVLRENASAAACANYLSRNVWLFAIFVFASLLAGIASANPVGYSVRNDMPDRRMYAINLATGAATDLGPTGFSKIEALAINDAGELFGVNPQSAQLVRCSTTTGACTAVGNLAGIPPGSTNAGLTFDATGRLLLAINAVLYVVNPTNASTTVLGPAGAAISGLARGAVTPNCASGIYAIGGNSDQGKLYCINATNGATTQVSLTNLPALDGGLDGDPSTGLVWGVLDGSVTILYAVAPGTFDVVSILNVTLGSTRVGGFESLAVARSTVQGIAPPSLPIPAPAASVWQLALLAGIVGLVGMRARRRARA